MSQANDSDFQYFAETANYGIVSLKCNDGRFYFIKHKRSSQVLNKSLDLEYLRQVMEGMEHRAR